MDRKNTEKYKKCNHHHEIEDFQEIVNFGSGFFVADKKRKKLLEALNECGLITRTHCYGHETGYSFVSILMDNDLKIEVKDVSEYYSTRKFDKNKKEILISWKRTD